MAKSKGWVKIDRSIMDNWVWKEKPFSKGQAWIDLILLAEYKDEDFTDSYGNTAHCEKGYVYMSICGLAKRWGWDRRTVDKFMYKLETQNMVKMYKKQGSRCTSVFLVNWAKFQGAGTTRGTRETNKTRTTSCTYLKKKNPKNCLKNIKEENLSEQKIVPDEEEIEWVSADKARPDRKGNDNGTV